MLVEIFYHNIKHFSSQDAHNILLTRCTASSHTTNSMQTNISLSFPPFLIVISINFSSDVFNQLCSIFSSAVLLRAVNSVTSSNNKINFFIAHCNELTDRSEPPVVWGTNFLNKNCNQLSDQTFNRTNTRCTYQRCSHFFSVNLHSICYFVTSYLKISWFWYKFWLDSLTFFLSN